MMHLGYANEDYLTRAVREVTDLLLAINSASTCIICYYFSSLYRVKFKQIFGIKNKEVFDRDEETQFAGTAIGGGINNGGISERQRLAPNGFAILNNK